jgi:hypothetical protein
VAREVVLNVVHAFAGTTLNSAATTAIFRVSFQTAKSWMRDGILAAQKYPSLARQCPSEIRGRKECRMHAAPIASRAKTKKHTSKVTTGTPKQAGIPCAMALTPYSTLFPAIGLFDTVIPEKH